MPLNNKATLLCFTLSLAELSFVCRAAEGTGLKSILTISWKHEVISYGLQRFNSSLWIFLNLKYLIFLYIKHRLVVREHVKIGEAKDIMSKNPN